MMDAQDRLWFAEVPRQPDRPVRSATERFQEWEAPDGVSAPYDIAWTGTAKRWTGSMLSDRILRLDPKSGRFVEYLLRGHQYPQGVCRQFRDAGRVLGRQQPRRVDHQARAARTSTPRQAQEPRIVLVEAGFEAPSRPRRRTPRREAPPRTLTTKYDWPSRIASITAPTGELHGAPLACAPPTR